MNYWVVGSIIVLLIFVIIFIFLSLNREVYIESDGSESNSLGVHGTDKNTIHSYIDVYENLFSRLQNSARNVLEIGVKGGQSILLWKYYFKNAHIYGMDISKKPKMIEDLDNISFYQRDAYKEESVNLFNGIKFDLMIDDGPHTLDSMIFFAKYYSALLSENGIMVIEDVQKASWFEPIKNAFPS